LRWLAGIAVKCAGITPRLYSPVRPDGWGAQPIAIPCRFTADADLDPVFGTPVGDEGYYLYVLNESANWDHNSPRSILFSIWQRPWAHSWLMLESLDDRLECGHTGDFGLEKPRFHAGVFKRIREGHPDPIAYLWEMMSDGEFQIGKPNRPPTFVWRMPITRQKYQLIQEYIRQKEYRKFGARSNNCTDMVVEVAALVGINLVHRICLILPQESDVWGRKRRVWTDPRYRLLDYSTPEVLDADLRYLAKMGIGTDVTKWYLSLKP
jgi:hypothetical protein